MSIKVFSPFKYNPILVPQSSPFVFVNIPLQYLSTSLPYLSPYTIHPNPCSHHAGPPPPPLLFIHQLLTIYDTGARLCVLSKLRKNMYCIYYTIQSLVMTAVLGGGRGTRGGWGDGEEVSNICRMTTVSSGSLIIYHT